MYVSNRSRTIKLLIDQVSVPRFCCIPFTPGQYTYSCMTFKYGFHAGRESSFVKVSSMMASDSIYVKYLSFKQAGQTPDLSIDMTSLTTDSVSRINPLGRANGEIYAFVAHMKAARY